MADVKLRSRILEYFSKELMDEICKITYTRSISDNNEKAVKIFEILDKYKMDYVELGCGTNRTAIKINEYVYKIALDSLGVNDNLNEIAMSESLQPYVIKAYESNGLIMVCEYVEVLLSMDELNIHAREIIKILSTLTSQLLIIDDVGINKKNFCNWGKRLGSNELCILDYAYIYRVTQDHLICKNCKGYLEYDNKFVNLKCYSCGKEYKISYVRNQLSHDDELLIQDMYKEKAYMLTEPVQIVKSQYIEVNEIEPVVENNEETKGEDEMSKRSKIIKSDEYEDDKKLNAFIDFQKMMEERIKGKSFTAEISLTPPEEVKEYTPVVPAEETKSHETVEIVDVEETVEGVVMTDEEPFMEESDDDIIDEEYEEDDEIKTTVTFEDTDNEEESNIKSFDKYESDEDGDLILKPVKKKVEDGMTKDI